MVKTQYSGGKKLKYAGKEKIPVEKHLACKCQCKVKEEVSHLVVENVAD